LKKNRQHSGQKKKDKHQHTDHTHKAKDRVTRTSLRLAQLWFALELNNKSCFTFNHKSHLQSNDLHKIFIVYLFIFLVPNTDRFYRFLDNTVLPYFLRTEMQWSYSTSLRQVFGYHICLPNNIISMIFTHA
jgi:hypothetical protein